MYKPYSVMSYKLTEFYSLGIPLFMPSPKFFRGLPNSMGADRSINVHFCSGAKNQGLRRPKHPNSPHPYSPNIDFKDIANNGAESEMYWLQFADFYDLPHITHFDSLDDLLVKLTMANLTEMHKNMMEENHFRKHKLLETWCDVIPKI